MEFYEAVNNRRTCRMWDDRDVIDRILNAAVKAPSNDHLRQWQFVILRTQEEKDYALQFVKAFDIRIRRFSYMKLLDSINWNAGTNNFGLVPLPHMNIHNFYFCT